MRSTRGKEKEKAAVSSKVGGELFLCRREESKWGGGKK